MNWRAPIVEARQFIRNDIVSNSAVIIVLKGEPEGKGRPRFRVIVPRGGKPFASVYTPKETRSYEDALKLAGRVAMGKRKLFDGPVDVTVTAIMSVPKSWSMKKRDAALVGMIWPTVTPDWDNIAKTLDGLNGVVWLDDKQIVRGIVVKRYGESPRLEVRVEETVARVTGV